MSNLQVANNAIQKAGRKFCDLATKTGLDFEAEALFAFQMCQKNDYLASIAAQNPVSLRMAMVNVAAVGLSLNPATGLAFLVPRDGQVVLDISYRGLIKIATDMGSILWAKAEMVYENDEFEYRGVSREPLHRFDPFKKNRGEFVGVYCIAKTPDNDYLVETMTAQDVYQVRALSKAFSKKGKGPWVDFFGQMTKKSVIKRGSNTWPKSSRSDRLHTAINILNEHEGLKPEYLQRQTQSDVIDSYDLNQISPDTLERVALVIKRAQDSSSWAAAEDYFKERYKGSELAYANDQLQEARKAA